MSPADQRLVKTGSRYRLPRAGHPDTRYINIPKMRDPFLRRLDLMQHRLPMRWDRVGVIPLWQRGITIGRVPVHGEQNSVAYAVHSDIADMDVLDGSATGSGRLYMKSVARAFGRQVGGEDMTDAAGR